MVEASTMRIGDSNESPFKTNYNQFQGSSTIRSKKSLEQVKSTNSLQNSNSNLKIIDESGDTAAIGAISPTTLTNKFISPIKSTKINYKLPQKSPEWQTSETIDSKLQAENDDDFDQNLTLRAALGPLPLKARKKSVDAMSQKLKENSFAHMKK